MDAYYLKCIDEWDELIDKWEIVHDLHTGKLVEVQVQNEGRSFMKKYSDGREEILSSSLGNVCCQKYYGIEKLSEDEVQSQLTSLRSSLKDSAASLSKDLEKRIRDPNPFKDLLGCRS